MSSQAYLFNPTERTLAATGDGFSCPRLTTAGRTALSLTANDKGMMVYDTTFNNPFVWNGSAWESIASSGDSSNTQVIFNNNGELDGDPNLTYDLATKQLATGTLKAQTTIGVGNASPSASGAGVSFPAAQSPSTDPNTLDDYEEGIFSPTVVGSTTPGTVTYTTQSGRYTKVGRIVYFQLYVVWTATDGTGFMRIGNLPFVSNNVASTFNSVSIGYFNNITTAANNVATAFVEVNADYVALYRYPVGGGAAGLISITATGGIMISGCYTV